MKTLVTFDIPGGGTTMMGMSAIPREGETVILDGQEYLATKLMHYANADKVYIRLAKVPEPGPW